MTEIKNCVHCDKSLSGRIDKRFCDANCRNAHNNKVKRSQERVINAVNRQLRKNRSILKTLCPLGKAVVRKQVLLDLGFSFQYFSTIYPINERPYYFSYEYGFCPIVERSKVNNEWVQKVTIIQKQDYMTRPFDPWK
ncbi:MAG: hypothetical protein OCD76_16075 [Reichenbachiella sp.]